MDVDKFKREIKKVSGKRKVSISGSLGNNEAYLNYVSLIPKEERLSSKEFRNLINRVNYLLSEELINTGSIVLPFSLGKLSIESSVRKPKMVNGKLYYNAPINWNKTLELWANDPESRVAKTTVKVAPGPVFRLKFHTTNRNYINRRFMEFKFTRAIKLRLKDKIVNKEPLAYVEKNNKI